MRSPESRPQSGDRCPVHHLPLPCSTCRDDAARAAAASEHAPSAQEIAERFWERVRQDREGLVTALREASRGVAPAVIPEHARVHVGFKGVERQPNETVVAIDGTVEGADATFNHHESGGGLVTMSPHPERAKGVIPYAVDHPTDAHLVLGTSQFDPDFLIGAALYAMGGSARVYRMLADQHGEQRADAIMRDLHNASVACDYLQYPDEEAQPEGRGIAIALSNRYYGALADRFGGKPVWQASREDPARFQQESNAVGTALLADVMRATAAGDLAAIGLPPEELATHTAKRHAVAEEVRAELTAHPEQRRDLVTFVDTTERKDINVLAFYDAAGTPVVGSMDTKTHVYNPIGVNPAFYGRLTMLPVVRRLQAKEVLARAAADRDSTTALALVDGWLGEHAPDVSLSQLVGKERVRGRDGAEVVVPADIRRDAQALHDRGYLANQWGGREVAFGGPYPARDPAKEKYSGSLLTMEQVMDTIADAVKAQLAQTK